MLFYEIAVFDRSGALIDQSLVSMLPILSIGWNATDDKLAVADSGGTVHYFSVSNTEVEKVESKSYGSWAIRDLLSVQNEWILAGSDETTNTAVLAIVNANDYNLEWKLTARKSIWDGDTFYLSLHADLTGRSDFLAISGQCIERWSLKKREIVSSACHNLMLTYSAAYNGRFYVADGLSYIHDHTLDGELRRLTKTSKTIRGLAVRNKSLYWITRNDLHVYRTNTNQNEQIVAKIDDQPVALEIFAQKIWVGLGNGSLKPIN